MHEVDRGHLYPYEARGGAQASSAALDVPLHAVIKTLIMEDDTGAPLLVLMHGDREVATGVLAKLTERKRVSPCAPDVAQRRSGYLVGGTSPFGLKQPMPIYAQETILALDRLWINGGKRGFLVSMTPGALERGLAPVWLDIAQPLASGALEVSR